MFKSTRDDGRPAKDDKRNIRYQVFRTIGMMEYSTEQLEREKNKIISLARKAKDRGDEDAYRSLKKRLSVCLVNTRLVSEMLTQLEIALQLDNMDRMVESYSSCMEALKKQHSIAGNPHTLLKNYKEAMGGVERTIDFYNTLYEDLSLNRLGYAGEDAALDSELEQMIGDSDKDTDGAALDAKIQLIRSRIKEAGV